jgi:hypothetical protein
MTYEWSSVTVGRLELAAMVRERVLPEPKNGLLRCLSSTTTEYPDLFVYLHLRVSLVIVR